jgi:hypothetical protein
LIGSIHGNTLAIPRGAHFPGAINVTARETILTAAMTAMGLVPCMPALAETFKCVTKSHVEVSDDGALRPSAGSVYIGSTFTVNVATGEWSGSPADNRNAPNRQINIVDPGNPGMAVTIITTRGGAIGRLADILVIKSYVDRKDKPFTYFDGNFGVFSGTCTRL